MLRVFLAGMICIFTFAGCEKGQINTDGFFQAEASVEVKYKVDWKGIPIADLPPEYQEWKVETDEYLRWVNWNIDEITKVRGGIAALFNVEVNADAGTIVNAIKSMVKVKVTLVVQAQANVNASSGMSTQEAHAQASGSGFARAEWKTEVTIDPDIKNKLNQVQKHIESLIQIQFVINTMENRGQKLQDRGMELHAKSVTDLEKDPTLIVHLEQIQATLEDGSAKCNKANAKVSSIRTDTDSILNALQTTFK